MGQRAAIFSGLCLLQLSTAQQNCGAGSGTWTATLLRLKKNGKKCCIFVRPIIFLQKWICFLQVIWITTLFNHSNDGLAILSHSEPEIHLRFAFLTLLLNSTLHLICMSKELRVFRDTFPQIILPRWTTFKKGSSSDICQCFFQLTWLEMLSESQAWHRMQKPWGISATQSGRYQKTSSVS